MLLIKEEKIESIVNEHYNKITNSIELPTIEKDYLFILLQALKRDIIVNCLSVK